MKLKKVYLAALIFITAAAARFFYLNNLEEVAAMFPDTIEYLSAADSILSLKTDVSRVPLYPLIIRFSYSLFSNLPKGTAVVLLQLAISCFGAVFLFFVSKRLFDSTRKALFLTIIYSINIFVLSWDFLVLTESISINCILMLIGFFILYCKTGKKAYIFAAFSANLVLIFIRPFYLFLPILTFTLFILSSLKKSLLKKTLLYCILSVLSIYTAVYGYSWINYVQNGYFGLTDVSAINKLGKIMQYDMYELSPDEEIKAIIRSEISRNGNVPPPPKEIIMAHGLNRDNYNRINSFTTGIIINNPVLYAKRTVRFILTRLPKFEFFTDYNYLVSSMNEGLLFKFYEKFYSNKLLNSFALFYLLCFAEAIYLLIKGVKSRRVELEWVFILTLIIYQFIMSVAGAHGEYHRLMSPVYLLVILLIFKYIYIAIDLILLYGLKLQFFRYALVGGAASVADISIYTFMTSVNGINPVLSNTVSFLAGLLINYFLSRRWVFKQTTANFKKDFTLFSVIGIIGLLLSNLMIYVFLDLNVLYNILFFVSDDFVKILAKLITVFVVLFWNFAARKKLVFANG